MTIRKPIAVVLLLSAQGCTIDFDLDHNERNALCVEHSDCPRIDVECVANMCIENTCTAVNLATTREPLPIDPSSGLPLGRGCRRVSRDDPPAPSKSCAFDCDCFDDNACTIDSCGDGLCQYEDVNGSCGDTVGTCRGSWCCTSEFTCFHAYDNGSLCD